MREFNLDLLIGKNVAVNCKTVEDANEFLKFLECKGIKWCDGTGIFKSKEYYFALFKEKTCFIFHKNKGLQFEGVDYFRKEFYKILSLDDLTIKPKNNFKKYGFEADFEGEILKEYENQFVGMVYQNEGNFGCSWDKKGRCLQPDGFGYYNMNLKPIKKEWYENPDNFPVVMIDIETKKPHIAYAYKDGRLQTEKFTVKFNKYRLATKEEVLSLLVKE